MFMYETIRNQGLEKKFYRQGSTTRWGWVLRGLRYSLAPSAS